MAIWMDMTNSMHTWKGGVVGIVRAELEIAKNLHAENPEIRFVKYDGEKFIEIKENELDWLWNADSVGDAYLSHMGRNQTAGTQQDEAEQAMEDLRKKYPLLDEAYNFSTSRLLRLVQGLLLLADTLPGVLKGIAKILIRILSWPFRKLSLMRAHRKEKEANKRMKEAVQVSRDALSYPFSNGDTVFSCGWVFSGKEWGYEQVKQELRELKLIYLIYDLIILREGTSQFYAENLLEEFRKYVTWVSMHCEEIYYGGNTAMKDTQAYQQEHHLPVRPGRPVYFGSDVLRSEPLEEEKAEAYAKRIGLRGKFVMAVGSLDARKNYSTLYRAMTILADREPEQCPQLVIVGKGDSMPDLLDTMERDPRTEGKIILTAPSDQELDWLYHNSAFILLASAYEGWSLTLPEALRYGKMVVVSDVEPLREIGRDLVVYADTYDPFDWANKISYYLEHPDQTRRIEKRVEKEYQPISWKDCGEQISNLLQTSRKNGASSAAPNIYVDITLTVSTVLSGGNITGILRTELMLIRELYRLDPSIRFFALLYNLGYLSIDCGDIAEIITGDDLDEDFNNCKQKLLDRYLNPRSRGQSPEELAYQKKKKTFFYFASVLSPQNQNKLIAYAERKWAKGRDDTPSDDNLWDEIKTTECYEVPLKKGDIVFTAGTSSGPLTYQKLLNTKEKSGYLYCPVIYDYTPVILPQVHQEQTVKFYKPFLKFNANMADFIFYGGETARQDGIAYQKKHDLPIPPSCAIRFGSNIHNDDDKDEQTEEEKADRVKEIFKYYGIKGSYILAVGTMEIRKNYETLYRAYLRMLEDYDDVPQLVLAGHPGWKMKDTVEIMDNDERIRGKIIRFAPSDEELNVLYKHCEFTLLASLYEGWSLTLPESYWYGKFCICCDTPALKEIAGELAEYIHGWDEKKWAERIMYYHSHPDELKKREKAIAKNWRPISWEECAESILSKLKELLGNANAEQDAAIVDQEGNSQQRNI